MIGNTNPLTLDANQLAYTFGYVHPRDTATAKAGEPRRRLVYTLVAQGKLPNPIDPTLPKQQWRWSRRIVTDFIDGGPDDTR